jgi:hypothetical protein
MKEITHGLSLKIKYEIKAEKSKKISIRLGLLGSGLCPSLSILQNTTFQKLDLFLSSGGGEGSIRKRYPQLLDLVNTVFFRILDDGQSPKTQ